MIDSWQHQCHQLVWRYRQRLNQVWPTPDPDDAMRFAITEAGEVLKALRLAYEKSADALDAQLREKKYARNNDREMDVIGELADCAMMLLTAFTPLYDHEDVFAAVSLDMLPLYVASALNAKDCSRTIGIHQALICINGLMMERDASILTEVEKRLKQIEKKHGGGGRQYGSQGEA